MDKRKSYDEKYKDIIDINSEVNWLKCRGDIDCNLSFLGKVFKK